ncbi:hypothetical protein DFH07DRAFT_857708 [Mycena maculata]|uniref:TERF2-interacting telomeric protein 1 Myb domain-containing protein n=1 Tax=Mycena maculata TaxID=230809 RepID=A0AAD7HIT2_9AGAR|nr:hypothetical protein DFH07DRAFT_857708 [Mycena maculata]
MEEEDEDQEFGSQEEFDDQLFVEQGEPLKFHLHRSIRLPGARNALQVKIETYGGVVIDTDVGSNVILVNPNHPSGELESVRHAYKTHSHPELKGVYVEAVKWVQNCVKNGKCVHNYIQKRMGGATYTGRQRASFTTEDDQKLAEYLATLIPNKTDGGRTGQIIYKRLINNAEVLPDEYEWVLRHTWQSWRERYKTRQEWFDPRISVLAKKLDPAPHQKYELSRNAPRLRQKIYMEEEEEENELEEEEWEEPDTGGPSRKHRISDSRSAQPPAKRPRTSRSPSPSANVVHGTKGKEKALPADDDGDDNYHSDGSLFGDYDPGPSGSQHTSPAEVHLPTQRSSQMTLVRTGPPHDVPPPDTSRNTAEPANVQPSLPRRQPPRVTRGARPIIPRSVAPARRKVSPEIIEVQGPYRSTRARSRSLEPYVADVDAVTRKQRQKGKEKVLEPVAEREGEEDEERDSRSREPEGTMETQEEQNVEDFLMAPNDQSGISDGGNTVNEAELMPPPRETRRQVAREHSLDTDDGQTEVALGRHRQVSFSPVARSSVASTFGDERAREVLRNIGAPRLSRPPESVTSKAGSSRRFTQNSPPDVFSSTRDSVRAPSIDLQKLFSRTSMSRKGSESSAESFPIPGTRARSMKREIKAHEKHTPYRPPAGTRAAALNPP